MGRSGPWVRRNLRGGVLVLGAALQELAGVLGIADSDFVIQAEHGGQVKRVRAAGQGTLGLFINRRTCPLCRS
jgi:hypothetical protein